MLLVFSRFYSFLPSDPSAQKGILLAIWAAVQCAAFFLFDMRSSIDSAFYLENAEALINGIIPQGRGLLYISYSSILAIIQLVGFCAETVIILQIVISGFSVFCLYECAKHLFRDQQKAFGSTLIYVLWFKFQQWNLILYTDSLFASLCLVSAFFLLKSRGAKDYIITALLLVFTSFLRPTGIALLAAAVCYVLYENRLMLKGRMWVFSTLIGGLVVLALVDLQLDSFVVSIAESYAKAEVIYPDISVFVALPDSFSPAVKTASSLLNLASLYWSNPWYLIKLAAVKGTLFLAHVKPYYSWMHNFFIVMFLYPSYLLAISSFRQITNGSIKFFIGSFICLQVVIVATTSINWDGRFLLPILPFVFLLAGGSLGKQEISVKNQ